MNLMLLFKEYRENGFVATCQRRFRTYKNRIFNYLLAKKLDDAQGLNISSSASLYGLFHMKIGKNFTAGEHFRLEAISELNNIKYTPRIVIKDNVIINDFVHIGATNYVEIGNNVLMGSKIYISDHNHGIYSGNNQAAPSVPPINRPLDSDKSVIIGDNVWIGEFVSILPGVHIGQGSIIGANSIVIDNIPPFSIAVGNPARVIKKYNATLKLWDNA